LKSLTLSEGLPLFLVLRKAEVRRTPLPGSWVVRMTYSVCTDTGMLTPHARIAVPLSPQRRSAAGLHHLYPHEHHGKEEVERQLRCRKKDQHHVEDCGDDGV
jgi:hypothetical protein